MWLAVGLVLGVIEWGRVKANVGAVWNGYGASQGTSSRVIMAPMRFRVLVPWLLAGLDLFGIRGVAVYQALKVGLMCAALAVVEQLVGQVGLLVAALLMALTFEFDYWDCYSELVGVGLVLLGSARGDIWQVVVGSVVWGLSKETVLIAPALGLLAGGVRAAGLALAGPVVLGLVWMWQGPAGLYPSCDRWTLRSYNARDLGRAFERRDLMPFVSVAWTAAVVVACWRLGSAGQGVLGRTAVVGLVWLLTGWTMARARETRVFMPTVLWLVGSMLAS